MPLSAFCDTLYAKENISVTPQINNNKFAYSLLLFKSILQKRFWSDHTLNFELVIEGMIRKIFK